MKFNSTFIALLFIYFSTITTAVKAAVPESPNYEATSYLLLDFHSNKILISKNITDRVEPASITKLMTAYVIYKELEAKTISIKDSVLISTKAWKMKGSRMFLEQNKRVPFNRILHGLIVQSGNDAAIALAEHIAGTEEAFVKKMNSHAERLGMDNTNFINVTGWPNKEHYTTAKDISILARTIIKEYPEHYKLYSIKEYSYNGIKQYNRNKLLWRDKTVDGMKTGHTNAAGYCLVSSALRNNMRLISIVLGAKNEDTRAEISEKMLELGYRFYETHKLYSAGSVLSEARIWKGAKTHVPAGVDSDFYVTIQKGHYEKLKGFIELDKKVDAPVKRGQIIGTAVIKDSDVIVLETPIVALDSIKAGKFGNKLSDTFKKIFSN